MPTSVFGKVSRVTRIIGFDCGGGAKLRGKLTVTFARARTQIEADAAMDTVAASVRAVVRQTAGPEEALGNEGMLVVKALRRLGPSAASDRVDLALLAPGQLTTTTTRRRPSEGVDRPGRVLVVDDDPIARATLEALLADEFEVIGAAGVAAAHRELAKTVFDVLLSDYEMPDGSGIKLLEYAAEKHPNVIAMLVTGHNEYPDVIAAKRDRRIFRVLLKPYDPEMLLGSVRSAVTLARMRETTARLSNISGR